MAISAVTQPPFIVDLESDRSTSWPDGCFVSCRDTHKMHDLVSGIWYQMSPTAQVQSDYAQASTGSADYIKNKPVLTKTVSSVTPSIVTGTGATGTQVSATRDALMSYSCTIGTTATIGGGSSGTIVLEICPTNSATPASWTEVSRITNGQVITLAVALQSVQTTAGVLSGMLPAGYYRKVRSINNSGTPTFAANSGQETLI